MSDFGEGGHETGGVPKPTSGFICVDLLHVALLRVLEEGMVLGTFDHRAMEGSDAITPLPGAHRGQCSIYRGGVTVKELNTFYRA